MRISSIWLFAFTFALLYVWANGYRNRLRSSDMRSRLSSLLRAEAEVDHEKREAKVVKKANLQDEHGGVKRNTIDRRNVVIKHDGEGNPHLESIIAAYEKREPHTRAMRKNYLQLEHGGMKRMTNDRRDVIKQTKSRSLFRRQLTSAQEQELLDAHNDARGSVSPTATNMKQMKWNSTLAGGAQSHADNCVWQHDQGAFGENLFASTGYTGPFSGSTAVTAWDNEKVDYDYTYNNCSAVCGHYTQVVWANSDQLGCGHAVCSTNCPFTTCYGGSWTFLVCRYFPPGNNGQLPYTDGTSCADCPGCCSNNLCTDSCTSTTTTPSGTTTTQQGTTTTQQGTTTTQQGTTTTPTTSGSSCASVTNAKDGPPCMEWPDALSSYGTGDICSPLSGSDETYCLTTEDENYYYFNECEC